MNDPTDNGKPNVKLNPTIDFIAGTIAGITGLAVGYPFDTVKVRFQSPQTSQKYHSTWNALLTITKEERFIGLYKGISSPLATCAFMNGLGFASYRFFMKVQLDNEKQIPTLWQIALAGAGSGIVSSIITTPTELIKIQQQNIVSGYPPISTRDMALNIYRQHGIKGLYRGITATALRDCGYGAYFAAYEATCRYFTARSSTKPLTSLSSDHSSIFSEMETEMTTLSWPALLVAGGVAGVAGWLATFPLDVVKTRVQGSVRDSRTPVSPVSSHWKVPVTDQSSLLNNTTATTTLHANAHPYRTTLSTVIYSYRTEGLGVFFKGLAPTLIRAIPVNMVTFAAFEAVVHALT